MEQKLASIDDIANKVFDFVIVGMSSVVFVWSPRLTRLAFSQAEEYVHLTQIKILDY